MFDTIRNVLSGDSQQPETDDESEDDDDEWQYEYQQDDVELVEGQPMIARDTEQDELFAGPLSRSMMEGPRANPEQPLFVGVGTRRGRHAGIEQEDLLKHTVLLGPTGYGKSTLMDNMIRAQSEADFPVVFIEPKGDDSPKLIDILPEHRIDNGDLVWLEPGGNRTATVGLNILDPGVESDDPMFDTAVENLVEDLTKMIGIDEYWGPRMDGITKTMVRATARLDYEFTLLDLYYILAEEENAREFANLVDQSGLEWLNYTEKIAEMDDDNLDPIRRRLKDWVEDPIARRVIAFRDSTVNLADIIEDRKILVVRMGPERDELKQMVSTAIIRRLWSHVRARSEMREKDRIPCNLFIDEFDYVAHQDSALPTMLSKARSLGLGIFMAMQYPSQVPSDVQEAMFANSNTVLSFKAGHPNHARQIADVLDIDSSILTSEAPHHVWMQMTVERNGRKETAPSFRTYCHPPYPPLRSEAERWHIIEDSARTYGRTPRSSEELREELLIDEGNGPNDDTDDPLAQPTRQAEADAASACEAVYKTVWDESIRQGDPGGWVDLTDTRVVERLADYTPGVESFVDHNDAWRRVVQQVPKNDPYLEEDTSGSGHLLQVDPAPVYAVGTKQNDGGPDHIAPLQDAYVALTQLGFIVEIPEQTGDAMPDGLVRLDDMLDVDRDDDPETIADAMVEFRDNHPLVHRLAGTRDAYIETEHTTGSSQPSQTVENLAQAANAGHRCLFLSREETAEHVYRTLGEGPFGCWSNHSVDGERRFYTGTQALRIDGEVITRPGASDNVWVHDEETDDYILRDTDGTVHARFDSPARIFEDADAYPAGGERNVKPPIIPEYEIDGDLDAVEWDVMIVPEPETDEDGTKQRLTPMDLRVIEDGQQISVPHLLRDDPPTHYDTEDKDREGDTNGGSGAATEEEATQEKSEEPSSSGEGEEYLADDLSNIFN
ncbi:type IV secretory system conjugative DNA transfer family protein [Haladaptatus sp. CMAA 1911]|uniref:type IV secretory system conjugative DNA transfer family protein n=1 Tax=unclassified Haladaptatus TaxID=2622732 RepID=UPI003753F3BC